MKRGLITAILAVALFSAGSFASDVKAAEAGPIADTYAVNVNGNPEGFVAAIKTMFEATKDAGATERRVLVSEIGGTGTGMVFVTVQYPSLGAMEEARAKVLGSEAWATFMETVTGMGMAPVSRQILRQVHAD